MESVDAPQKRDINILSNILLSDDIFKPAVAEYSDIPNKENVNVDCQGKGTLDEPPSLLFKNLTFELPGTKRKNSFGDRTTAKKLRTKSSSDECDDPVNDDKIFNYLTGTYESIKQTVKEELLEDSLEIKEESFSFDEDALIKETFEGAPCDNSSAIVLDDITVKDDPTEALKFEVFDNSILNSLPISEGQLNDSILGTILKETHPQVLKSSPAANAALQLSKSNANLDKSMLRHYLASGASVSKGASGQVTESRVIVLNQHEKLNFPDSAPLLASNLLPSWEYKCKLCSHVAKTQPEFMSHFHSVHSNGQKRPHIEKILLWKENTKCDVALKCLDCDTVFADSSQLEQHACIVHPIKGDVLKRECSSKGASANVPCKSSLEDQGRTLLSEQKNCSKVLASTEKNCKQTSSILYSLLTTDTRKHSPLEASRTEETIEIFSDDGIAAVTVEESNALTENGHKTRRGTNGDNIVVLSDGEIRERSSSELFKYLCSFSAKNEVSQELPPPPPPVSVANKQPHEISTELKLDVDVNEGITSSPATPETDGSDDAIGGGHETSLNMAEDETNENNDIRQEEHDRTGLGANANIENSDVDYDDSDQDQAVGETHKLNLQCFDCRGYSNAGDLPQYRLHVAKHIGSKFRCMPHSDASAKDCAKCYYETTLSDVAKCIKRCLRCGFVTDEASKLKAHREQNDACDVSCSPGDVKCFHCPYVTSRRKYLYYHAVDHIEERFACAKHISASSDVCPECVYEHCLKMAKRDVLDCDICGFKTVIMAVFDVHQCSNTCIAPYTCWDCKLDTFNTVDELREHAVVHYKSEFRCEDHRSAVNNCSQCLYQALADSLEGNVFVCKKCDFRSSSEESFGRHCAGGCSVLVTSQLGRTDNQLECFLCDYKTSSKNLLKHHCKKHYGETFACHNHTSDSPQVDCPRCTYQKLLSCSRQSLFVCDKCNFKTFNGFHFKSHTSQSHPTLPFQCFDCAATFKSSRGLKYHAVRHCETSKFKCPDHNSKSTQAPTCQKCIYENMIGFTKESSFTCKKCGFKSYGWTHMKYHESDQTHCKAYEAKLAAEGKPVTRPKPVEIYSCFDCDFSHERLDFLKAHVKAHRASKFQCDQHNTPKANCPKCRHVQLVAATLRRRLYCYDCGRRKSYMDPLDLHRHVAEKHPASNFACTRHVEKKDNCCGGCLYQEAVENVVGDDYVKLICWDCDGGKLFPSMALYEDHIVCAHVAGTFSCPEHGGKKPKRCSKCHHQVTLQRRTPPKTLTFQCFQCDYSHKQIFIFKRHVQRNHASAAFECDKHPSSCPTSEYCPQCFYYRIKIDAPSGSRSLLYRCYECDRAFRRLRYLKSHVKVRHKKCSFVCALHPEGGATNCAGCLYETLARDVDRKKEYLYECSSCSYKSDNRTSFKSHKHRKFKCKEHSHKDCSQCFYAANDICYACANPTPLPHINALKEHIVDNHKASAFVCPSHTVKTLYCDKCSFQQLLERTREQQRAPLRCFDCDYETAKFPELRSHVWKRHRGSEYRCNEHHLAETANCQKCLYATVVENARMFVCYGCKTVPVFTNVDALKGHVNEAHKNDFFVCPDHSRSCNGCGKCFFQEVISELSVVPSERTLRMSNGDALSSAYTRPQ